MLKRVVVSSLVAACAASPLFAQGNPRGEATARFGGKSVVIDYGRPSLKGRDMLGQARVGDTWRMGADAATTLSTEVDLKFGSTVVPKGDYVLTAKKAGEDEWHLLVSKRQDRSVVAAVPLAGSKLDESVEMFTIDLKGKDKSGELEMKWGTRSLKASFTVQ